MRSPGLKGPSNFTPNHEPNCRESLIADHTRARGARRNNCFSIGARTLVMCNLLVASLDRAPGPTQPGGCRWQRDVIVSIGMADVVRIALANLPYPANRNDALARAVAAVTDAGAAGAAIVCF